MMNQRPEPRRVRRQRTGETRSTSISQIELPGPLRLLTNPKVFIAMGLMFLAAIVFSLLPGLVGGPTATDSGSMQGNEAPDVAVASSDDGDKGTPAPASATPGVVKRYVAAPALTIDPAKKYTATISTSKGDIKIDLFTDQASAAVNAFVFLAKDGYYANTPFMQVAANADGTRFTAQAGDPTRTGCGTPGFDVNEQPTSRPFVKGAVGYDSGQFFISYGDQPGLNGKSTIVGQVVSGQDVLDRLTLQQVRNCVSGGSGDVVQSVTITES